MLCDLLSVAGVTEEQLQEHSFLVTNVEDRKKFASQKKTLLDTYNRVIREQIMSYQKRLSLVPSTIISTVKPSTTARQPLAAAYYKHQLHPRPSSSVRQSAQNFQFC